MKQITTEQIHSELHKYVRETGDRNITAEKIHNLLHKIVRETK